MLWINIFIFVPLLVKVYARESINYNGARVQNRLLSSPPLLPRPSAPRLVKRQLGPLTSIDPSIQSAPESQTMQQANASTPEPVYYSKPYALTGLKEEILDDTDFSNINKPKEEPILSEPPYFRELKLADESELRNTVQDPQDIDLSIFDPEGAKKESNKEEASVYPEPNETESIYQDVNFPRISQTAMDSTATEEYTTYYPPNTENLYAEATDLNTYYSSEQSTSLPQTESTEISFSIPGILDNTFTPSTTSKVSESSASIPYFRTENQETYKPLVTNSPTLVESRKAPDRETDVTMPYAPISPSLETTVSDYTSALPTNPEKVSVTETPNSEEPVKLRPMKDLVDTTENIMSFLTTNADVTVTPWQETIQPLLSTEPAVFSTELPTVAIESFKLVDYDCSQGDRYHPVENECDSYIECGRNTSKKIICPDGLHFNPNAVYPSYPCVYPTEIQCKSGSLERNPRPTNECPRQFGYFGMNDGDCSRFVMCQSGKATLMGCPLGLVFNEDKGSCDWPENVPQCNPYVFNDIICPLPPLDENGEPSNIIYKYRYKDSCKSYVACRQGRPRLLGCDEGLAFEESLQSCIDVADVSNCII